MCVELEIDMDPTAHSWKMLKTSGGTLKWLKCVASWVIVVARWCSTVQPLGASMSGLPLTTFCHGTANEVMLDNYEWINVYNRCIYIYIGSQCDSETARGVLNLRTFVFVVLKKALLRCPRCLLPLFSHWFWGQRVHAHVVQHIFCFLTVTKFKWKVWWSHDYGTCIRM